MIKHTITTLALAGAIAASWTALPAATANAASFNLTSSKIKDGGMMAKQNAGNNPQNKNCDGKNVSPALAWSNPPAKTQSYVIMLLDMVGRAPLGVTHWLAYNIPAATHGFKEGEVSADVAGVTGGKSTMGLATYFGPCPPMGDKPHPYTFILVATDLAPGTLKAGMTREELAPELQGHVLGSTSLVTRYGH